MGGQVKKRSQLLTEISDADAPFADSELADDSYLLSALLEHSTDRVYFKDSESRFVRISRHKAELLGLSDPSEAIGKTDQDFLADGHEADRRQDELYVMQSGRSLIGKEEREEGRDGTVTWTSTSKMPLFNAAGKCIGTFGISHDISRLMEAESARSSAHYDSELFINSLPFILVGLTVEGRIQRWNPVAAQVFGISNSAAMGKPFGLCGIKWLGDCDIDSEIRSLTGQTTPARWDLRFEKAGEERLLGITLRWITRLGGGTTELLIVGADVTERKRADDEKLALEAHLRQAQKLEAIGQLAAGIAHEINTPIQYVGDNTTFFRDSWGSVANMLTAARQLREELRSGTVSQETIDVFDKCSKIADVDYLAQEVPQAIDQTLEGVQRVAKIVSAMKEFSHPGSLEKRAVDLNRAIETTITISRNEWKYVAEMKTSLDPELPLVPCLAGEINQVLLNLVVNASHAIADVPRENGSLGTITLSTRRDGDGVEIGVADTGTGIPDHVRDKVFDPFFTTKEVGKGTGQGLMLAHSVVVKKHGGRIWFDSEFGKGTTFFIRLPIIVPVEK
jgi:PAS domain S-box-containing protein